ncbi:MAG: class I SAM-dependent methyltransferase [Odoribacter sp.]|nr:class I SAM-dependent methyltransferase [Odoribacter sp.]
MFEISPELEKYIEEHSEKESDVLQQLRRETHLHVMRPRMMSGNLQAQLLKMFCHLIGAKTILEIGTYTGYAAIAMAETLPEEGKLYTIDSNDEIEDIVRKYISISRLEEKITFHVGDAVKVIPDIEETFDLVFIDTDKRQYSQYYKLVFNKLRKGGLIITDDVLWEGKVVEEQQKRDAQTQGIIDFNEMIKTDERVEKIILPFRHGLYLIRKK